MCGVLGRCGLRWMTCGCGMGRMPPASRRRCLVRRVRVRVCGRRWWRGRCICRGIGFGTARALQMIHARIPLQHLPSHSMPALWRVLVPPAHLAFFAARLPPWALSRRANPWPCPVGPPSTSAASAKGLGPPDLVCKCALKCSFCNSRRYATSRCAGNMRRRVPRRNSASRTHPLHLGYELTGRRRASPCECQTPRSRLIARASHRAASHAVAAVAARFVHKSEHNTATMAPVFNSRG